MIRYPIFLFGERSIIIFDSREDHWNWLEPYALDRRTLLDSDGRSLKAADAGNDRVDLSDSGAEPDPQRLRSMLIDVLERMGWQTDSNASTETLTSAAREALLSQRGFFLWKKLLRFLRLRKAGS